MKQMYSPLMREKQKRARKKKAGSDPSLPPKPKSKKKCGPAKTRVKPQNINRKMKKYTVNFCFPYTLIFP